MADTADGECTTDSKKCFYVFFSSFWITMEVYGTEE